MGQCRKGCTFFPTRIEIYQRWPWSFWKDLYGTTGKVRLNGLYIPNLFFCGCSSQGADFENTEQVACLKLFAKKTLSKSISSQMRKRSRTELHNGQSCWQEINCYERVTRYFSEHRAASVWQLWQLFACFHFIYLFFFAIPCILSAFIRQKHRTLCVGLHFRLDKPWVPAACAGSYRPLRIHQSTSSGLALSSTSFLAAFSTEAAHCSLRTSEDSSAFCCRW